MGRRGLVVAEERFRDRRRERFGAVDDRRTEREDDLHGMYRRQVLVPNGWRFTRRERCAFQDVPRRLRQLLRMGGEGPRNSRPVP